jgi:hypothetical protein
MTSSLSTGKKINSRQAKKVLIHKISELLKYFDFGNAAFPNIDSLKGVETKIQSLKALNKD